MTYNSGDIVRYKDPKGQVMLFGLFEVTGYIEDYLFISNTSAFSDYPVLDPDELVLVCRVEDREDLE